MKQIQILEQVKYKKNGMDSDLNRDMTFEDFRAWCKKKFSTRNKKQKNSG